MIALFMRSLTQSPIRKTKNSSTVQVTKKCEIIAFDCNHDLPYILHIEFNGAIKQHSLKVERRHVRSGVFFFLQESRFSAQTWFKL